jgi:hypothetical protein
MTIQKLKGRVTGVYGITYKNKIYIGKALHIRNRWNGHMSHLRHNKHSCRALQRIFNDYNKERIERGEEPSFDCFDFFTLKELDQGFVTYHYDKLTELFGTSHGSRMFSKMILIKLEQVYMNMYPKNRLNSLPAANGPTGYDPTPETRKKIGDARRGQKHKESTKKKQSEAKKGTTMKPESRAKLSASKLGVPRDPDAVERSAAKRRKPFRIYKAGVGYIEGLGLKTYAKDNKISYGGLRDVMSGKYPMSNMHFRSEEDYFSWLKAKESQSSKEIGVYYHINTKRWIARDFSKPKPYLGSFKTEQEAIDAVRKSKTEGSQSA